MLRHAICKHRTTSGLGPKGFDTFCPIGSVSTVSPNDFPDVTLVTRVNGEERQRAKASEMVFSIPSLISSTSPES